MTTNSKTNRNAPCPCGKGKDPAEWLQKWEKCKKHLPEDIGDIQAMKLILPEDYPLPGNDADRPEPEKVDEASFFRAMAEMTVPAMLHVKTEKADLYLPVATDNISEVMRSFCKGKIPRTS